MKHILFISVMVFLSFPALAQNADFQTALRNAEGGDAQAQFNLGAMYLNGEGVAKSDQEAEKWFRLAADQENDAARRQLNEIYARNEARSSNASSSNSANRSCTSNADQINIQVQNISQAYDTQIADLERERSREKLKNLASYNLIALSGEANRNTDRVYNSRVAELNLQRQRDIADLRSRIIEICDPAPAPVQQTPTFERASSIANTLQQLNELYVQGALTNEEFQAAKRRALGLD